MDHYVVGLPAKGDNFYGRERELQIIMRQPWIWVCGQRRMGKTSLLYRAQESFEQLGYFTLFCDLAFMHEMKASGAELFTCIIRINQKKLEQVGITLDDFGEMAYADSYRELLLRLRDKGHKVAFLWDEAERLVNVEKNDRGFLERLRSQLVGFDDFHFAIAATQGLTELFAYKGRCSNFLATFRWLPLNGLEQDDSRNLFNCEHTHGWLDPLPEKIVEQAVQWAGGHPLILQELGSEIANRTGFDSRLVSNELVDECSKKIVVNPQLKWIIEDDFAKLTHPQQAVLKIIFMNFKTYSYNEIHTLIDSSPREANESISFLNSYGYITISTSIRLRFLFYPQFLSENFYSSASNTHRVSRIRRSVFISYSRQDEAYYKRLLTHLKPVAINHELEIWHDRTIDPGAKWLTETEQALERAWAAILIITPDFLSSKFITTIEVPKLLIKAEQAGCRIYCLYVRPAAVNLIEWDVNGKKIRLTDFQGLNDPQSPLSKLTKTKQDDTYVKCAETIFKSVYKT